MISRIWLIAVLSGVVAPTSADSPVLASNKDPLSAKLAHFAEAVGIEAVSESGPDEIRLWTRDYMMGFTRAYVAKDGADRTCETTSEWSVEAISIARGGCSPARKTRRADDALRLLPALAQYDQQEWDCPGVSDGWSVMIEGVVGGKTFAFRYSNADSCEGDVANLVQRLLSLATTSN